MDHLATWYRPSSQDGHMYVLDKDGKAKLGAFGLALLALSRKLEQAPDPADRDRALQLGRQIVAMQQPDGSFDSYLSIKGDEPEGSVSLYYPGEAMLGLARVAALGIDEGFLAAAHKGADFLIASRQGKTKLPPDAWLIQALDVLYQNDPKPSYVEHAMAISASMLADQYGQDAPPIYVGGFGNEPVRSTRTTARAEGIVAAIRLGFRAGDARAPAYLAAVQKTVPHLMTMQYDADNSFFLDAPETVRGGMRGGLDDAEIRIDYVQHYISALLGLAGLLAPPASASGSTTSSTTSARSWGLPACWRPRHPPPDGHAGAPTPDAATPTVAPTRSPLAGSARVQRGAGEGVNNIWPGWRWLQARASASSFFRSSITFCAAWAGTSS
jgi:hypothetical protein